ncbi:thioredoxin family protein [Gorillibacterium sp. sgz5001074]|uniref:thioredoxin family protein n=1 Tax=Gorillibacterium sp. sgz5001074 TaxID=3446695 RepID=UPI003F67E07B
MGGISWIDVDEDSFNYRVLEADRPVLVEFWAPWCEPCQRMMPILEELAAEAGDRAVVARVNADDNRELLFRLKVRGIPSMKLFRDGRETAHLAGYRPKEELLRLLLREPEE